MGFAVTIARRAVGLSKAYPILGVALGAYAIALSNIPTAFPSNPISSQGLDLATFLPFVSIALMSLTVLLVTTPVELIFVYDKNDGVLEYLLSTGMDQMDVFKAYLKAAVLLSGSFLIIVNMVNIAVGLILGADRFLLLVVTLLTIAVGVSTVAFVTVAMIAFSSLQKTRAGSNQPLGIAVGIIPMFPFFIIPIAFPGYAVAVGFLAAAIVALVAAGFLLGAGRLIQRERLLP